MTEITSLDLVAFAVEVVVLIACAVTLLAALVAYRHQVLYRTGVRWLAASLVLVTIGAIVELWGLAIASDVVAVVAMAIYTAASAAITLSMWAFARGFIELGTTHDASVDDHATDELAVGTPNGERGFEDAGK